MSSSKNDFFTVKDSGKIRKHSENMNWSIHPLGERNSWDPAFQALFSMVLANPMSMCLYWGQDFLQFFNESFRKIWDRDISATFGYSVINNQLPGFPDYISVLHAVFQGEVIQVSDELHISNSKKKFYDLTFSPVHNSGGEISGVLLSIVETTKKKLVEERLADKVLESEYNLSLVIHQAPIAIAILRGSDYKVEIANKNVLGLWGKYEQDIIGQSIFQAIPGLKTHGMKKLLDHVMRTGKRFSASEYPFKVNENGKEETVYINFSFEPLFDAARQENGVMAIGVDVTQQVKNRKAIEESEQSIRSIVENAPFPIAVYEGIDLTITLANQSIMDVWGKGNDVLGKSYKTILPELEGQKIFDQVYQVYSTGIPFHAKNQLVSLSIDGVLKPFYFNYSFTPLYNTSGQIYGVMNTAADVTEIHIAMLKVEESEKRFRDSVKQAPLGIVILRGRDYVVEMANENYLQLVDRSEEAFVGKPLFETLPEVKKSISHILEEITHSGQAFYGDEFPVTLDRYGKHELSYFNFVYHPLKDDDGQITGIMVVAIEVTETVKAKHFLEESEKHFRDMVMQSPIPMAILKGKDHTIDSANKKMLQSVWRKSEEDLVGKPILKAFPELEGQKYPQLLNHVYTFGKSHSEKESLATIAGDDGIRDFYLDFEYAPIFNAEQEVSGIMITVHDVTDKVEARMKIQASEERLSIVVKASELGVWEHNLKNDQSTISSRVREIFAFGDHELVSHLKLLESVYSEDKEKVKEAYTNSYLNGTLYYQTRIVLPKGSIRWIEVRGNTFFDPEGNPERLVGTIRDVSQEKMFTSQLLEREEKFRLLADSMPQLVWTSDSDGVLNYFNKAFYEFTGCTYEDLCGDGWVQVIHPDDRERNITEWQKAINSGSNYHFEQRFRNVDGTYRWQLSRAIPQKDVQGNIRMWVGSSTDIQEQKVFSEKLERQVRERTRELNLKNIDLEKMNKELQSFAYVSSHDLQEPLRKIRTFTDLIMEDEYPKLSDQGKVMFDRITSAASRMQTLIQDLLAYSRTNSQQRIYELVPFRFLVDQVQDDLSEEIKRKSATLEVDSVCSVNVIPFQFRQLLSNLLSNAFKFSDVSRDPLVKISCHLLLGKNSGVSELEAEQRYSHIVFSDNGIGFDPLYSERIFEVFQRLHTKTEYSGTGIGLAIVKKIVDNHYGVVKASGELGKGARFDIYIPSS